MPRRKTVPAAPFSAASFLRSINLCYDAEAPERIAHLHPTTKSIALLNALLGEVGERAHLVVAPYGSGKSLLATYFLHVLENREQSLATLMEIETRLGRVSPTLATTLTKRRKNRKQRGLVFALHGFYPSVAEGIKQSAIESMKRCGLKQQTRSIKAMPAQSAEDAVAIVSQVQSLAQKHRFDRVTIVWDEFGRHAESLVAEGRSASLSDLQLLAEYASRSRKVPVSIALLVHQAILHYAGNAPQSVRREWAKIEGRFKTIQYVDDSKEIYSLIADVVSARDRHAPEENVPTTQTAKECRRHALFTEFSEIELKNLLERAYPLDPTTLYLLPRVSARVAQNERTLFSFVSTIDLRQQVSVSALYDYFSPSMRADTAVGGTYRQWLETQSALSKMPEDSQAMDVLKTACLLGFGTGGERSRANRALLAFAVRGYRKDASWNKTINQLITRKLLLHRKHSDEVSVWHGTDIDLRRRLEKEKRFHSPQFDCVEFLSREFPPPTWRPTEYNDDFYIRRYFSGSYHSVESLKRFLNGPLFKPDVPIHGDGEVLYLLAESASEREEAETIVQDLGQDPRLVIALPGQPVPLFDAALEVWSLMKLQTNAEVVAADPMIGTELQQMADDARHHLQRLVDRLVLPSEGGARWFNAGRELDITHTKSLRRALSTIMESVYAKTPRIKNEIIVRRKPTAVVVNARKKLLLGILERCGKENLGIHGNFPDSSMFRSVLLHTGLYYQDSTTGAWQFANVQSQSITDENLRDVWCVFHDFLTKPSSEPKRPAELFENLRRPPYGVRDGLFPILFAAGLKAFPSAISLTRKGTYVLDILPSEIEELCREPDNYRLIVLNLTDSQRSYLQQLHRLFSSKSLVEDQDLIRQSFDAIGAWKAELPAAAQLSRRLPTRAQEFRRALERVSDPVQLFLKRIPEICGDTQNVAGLIATISDCKQALESVTGIYAEQASDALRQTLSFGERDAERPLTAISESWVSCFPEALTQLLPDGMAKGLLTRMRMGYESDQRLLESLSSLFVGRPIANWDDATLARFHRELNLAVREAETIALREAGKHGSQAALTREISALLRGRLQQQFDTLVNLVGMDEAKKTLASLEKEHEENIDRGKPKGRLRKSAG